MHNAKIISILRSFDNKELDLFENFIMSPIYNKNQNIVRLFGIIKEFHPAYEDSNLLKEKVFISLFPGGKYNDQKMRHLKSELLSLGEEFLILMRFRKDPLLKNTLLLSELRLRKLDRLFEKNWKEIQIELNNFTEKDEDYYYSRCLIESERHSFYYLKNKYSFDKNFQDVADNLLYSFLINILAKYSAMMTDVQSRNAKFDFPFLNEIMDYLKKNPHDHIVYISIFYRVLNLYLNGNDHKNFSELAAIIGKNHNKLYLHNVQSVYIHLLNYCNRKIRDGEFEFMKEKFSLIKESLPLGLHYRDGYFIEILFNNFVDSALNLGEFKWAEKFIGEFKDKLKPDDKTNICNLNYAKLHYFNKSYEKALDLLATVKVGGYVRKLEVRKITLKIYYELNYYEQLVSVMDAIRHFISNNPIPDNVKESESKFIKCLNEIVNIKFLNGEKTAVGSLRTETAKIINFTDRSWLLEKIEQLIS